MPGSWTRRSPRVPAELIPAEPSKGIHATAEAAEGVPAELIAAPLVPAAEHVRKAAEAELTLVTARRLSDVSIRLRRISEKKICVGIALSWAVELYQSTAPTESHTDHFGRFPGPGPFFLIYYFIIFINIYNFIYLTKQFINTILNLNLSK